MAEAIATGLYDPEGRINEKDAELAVKIEDPRLKRFRAISPPGVRKERI